MQRHLAFTDGTLPSCGWVWFLRVFLLVLSVTDCTDHLECSLEMPWAIYLELMLWKEVESEFLREHGLSGGAVGWGGGGGGGAQL